MNLKGLSLAEVAAIVTQRLKSRGIDAVVVGGSAITARLPDVYVSRDIDFATISGATTREFAAAVAELGFVPAGRDFVHAQTQWTLDLVADTPYVDKRPIKEYDWIRTRYGRFRVLKVEDAICDRVAAFLHWNDSQSLEVARKVVATPSSRLDWKKLRRSLNLLDASAPGAKERLQLAIRVLNEARV